MNSIIINGKKCFYDNPILLNELRILVSNLQSAQVKFDRISSQVPSYERRFNPMIKSAKTNLQITVMSLQNKLVQIKKLEQTPQLFHIVRELGIIIRKAKNS